MEKHGLKGLLSHLFEAGEDHTDDPEENDVVAGDEHVCRIEVLEVLCHLRPSQGREGPEGGGEPGIQRIGILGEMCPAADRAFFGHGGSHDCLPALAAVVGRDPVTPPELAADTPVADIVGPVEIDLFHPLGDQLDVLFLHRLHGRLDQLIHFDEPLFFDQGFDGGSAAVMGADIVGIVLDADQETHFIEFLHDLLPALIPVHTGKFGAVLIDRGIVVHDIDLRKIMALSDLKVIGVVSGSDLDHAGPELAVDIGVRHDGDLPVHEGKPDLFADKVRVALILGMDSHSGIAKHGLGTGSRELQEPGRGDTAVVLDQRILDVPEMAVLLLVLDLGVRDGGLADRAPVDDAAALVDPALFVHLAENFRDGLIAALVHGEALAVPVTGGAQLFELVHDPAAVFLSPVPALLEEALTAQIRLLNSLRAQRINDLDLGRNTGMVCPGLPEGVISLHPLIADQDILEGVVQGVAHVELAGDVGRRDHDGEGGPGMIHLGVKVFFFFPVFVDPVLDSLRIVGLCKFSAHFILLTPSSCLWTQQTAGGLRQMSANAHTSMAFTAA